MAWIALATAVITMVVALAILRTCSKALKDANDALDAALQDMEKAGEVIQMQQKLLERYDVLLESIFRRTGAPLDEPREPQDPAV